MFFMYNVKKYIKKYLVAALFAVYILIWKDYTYSVHGPIARYHFEEFHKLEHVKAFIEDMENKIALDGGKGRAPIIGIFYGTKLKYTTKKKKTKAYKYIDIIDSIRITPVKPKKRKKKI